ncbi:hypothetical protein KDD30_03730 [Photobacterium sp. GJ3]|uniref:DNA methyltransferase n=1 Tax=Photobacterium sp. GJ3 TaxID=2829502 RepID=UPI001B8C3F26|nr:DNA methyltransferase [Photobacterium sp. GJ3]QUJ68260.1 hypothetical protein KDD30_03730 [Photobacterium sp. GJ3]
MIGNAKRTKNERQGVHSWHPYYAGYSEAFVESVLLEEKTKAKKINLVLDPWVGSGTTGVVCQKNEVDCIGVDINFAMATFAASKSSLIIEELKNNGPEHIKNIMSRASLSRKPLDISHLIEFCTESHAIKIARIQESINQEFEKNKVYSTGIVEPVISFFKSVLLITNREILGYQSGSNPTWFKNSSHNKGCNFSKIKDTYSNNFNKMLQDLCRTFGNAKSNFEVKFGSSQSLPVQSESIDLIITSPPYLTRIDYAVSTKVELLTLTNSQFYFDTRKDTIGTTMIVSQSKEAKPEWGKLCENSLNSIRNHYSYSSEDYYIKNKVQYFESTYKSLNEIYRVLNKKSSAYLVIQNSYYKEIDIPLPDIYKEMALNIGFRLVETVRSDVIKTNMVHINSKSRQYCSNKIYHEDIIRLEK